MIVNLVEIELTWSVKSPLTPLYPPGQRPYGPAAKEGIKGKGNRKATPTLALPRRGGGGV